MSTLRRRIMVLGGGDIGGYVDLGLPSGALWAVGNLVKDSQGNYSIGEETDWGTYVSWGNIDGHNEGELYSFSSTNYNRTPGRALKANIPSSDSAHDICLARLGAPWRLPTKEDFKELYDNTDSEWVANYNSTGVAGRKFMKKSDHSVYVFFPASGRYDGTTLEYHGMYGYFWSASFSDSTYAYSLNFVSRYVSPQNIYDRYRGFTVRPICKAMHSITITLTGENVEGITVTVRDSEGFSHSGTTNSNGVVRLTGVYCGIAKVFTKDYYITPSHITVNASSRMFTCGLEQRESKYLTFYSITDCTHKFTKAVDYSLDDGITWQSLAAGTNLTVAAGSSVMWKATLTPSSSYPRGIGKFSVTTNTMRFDVEGNPMSLLYGDNFIGQTDLTGKDWTFSSLFGSNTGVVDARNMALPATTLASYCYNGMFSQCTSLTTAPELPATTLAIYCYYSMFSYCSSLTTAPELPATTLASYCYSNMFSYCSSLTTAPELPATTLASYCYNNMFSYCSSLTTAPELPATRLVDYCYKQMFAYCSSLNYIKCMATNISASGCLDSWVQTVAYMGTFVKASGMTSWPTGTNGIPSNWTVVDA